MARIRSVHPGLFTDEAFAQLSDAAQIFWIGLWTEADDHGVFEWKPVTLKMRLRPASLEPVVPLLDELTRLECIKPFEVDGKKYGLVRNFSRFQRPKKPTYAHPYPAEFRTETPSSAPSSELTQDDTHLGGELMEHDEPSVHPEHTLGGEIAPQMEEILRKVSITPPIVPPKGVTKHPRQRRIVSQIPTNWQPDEAGMTYATANGVAANGCEVEKFRDYHIAHGSRMADWNAAWRTWCRNAKAFGRTSSAAPAPSDQDDPWGVNAWIAKQTDAEETSFDGVMRVSINGWAVDSFAEKLALAAKLPPSWRGNWDCLGNWLRDDLGEITETAVLDAVRSQATRMNGISSVAVFDATVRAAAARCKQSSW